MKKTTIKDITNYIEEIAPLPYAEGFDNVGLLVGDYQTEVRGVLVTLDTLENVVDEAIKNDCNLIVSFHPIIFSGLKKLTPRSYVERTVIKAIKNDIAIYAMHTALDNSFVGVNDKICETLGLTNRRILIPQKDTIKKMVFYVPKENAESVKEALFTAGAGAIGNYSNCSFNVNGIGTFKGNDSSSPVVGEKGVLESVEETMVSMTYPKHRESAVLSSLFKAHPYEEVAYEITTIENKNQHIGLGMIGELEEEMDEVSFLKFVKKQMNAGGIRHSKLLGKPVKKVAVLGGSGSFAIENALREKADVYVTSDIKYHEFYKAENQMVIADIGHFESEQFTKNLLVGLLTKKFHNFAIILSKEVTNPIYYI